MIGVSVSALQRIELGSLKLSPSVASRISAVTDVDEKCLMRTGLPIKDASGENYTRQHFERCHRRFQSQAARHECEYVISELCDRISILLRAADSRHRFPLVASDLWSATDKLRKTYGLERLTNDLLRANSCGAREKWTSIVPPGKLVFFDDEGYQLFSRQDKVTAIASHLSIGHESLAYGLSDDGFVLEIRRAASSSNRDGKKRRPARRRSPATRLRSKRGSAIRKQKA
jgi:hypothetical protein